METKRRKPLRLKAYNYRSPGYYYVTFCALDRACIFGEILGLNFIPSTNGEKISEIWNWLPEHFLNVSLDVMQVMPNHVHAIIIIEDTFRDSSKDSDPFKGQPTLGQIVGFWKYQVSTQLNCRARGVELWQDNMWEHIIRNERELAALRQYTIDNPGAWAEDCENPFNLGRLAAFRGYQEIERVLSSPPGAETAPLQLERH